MIVVPIRSKCALSISNSWQPTLKLLSQHYSHANGSPWKGQHCDSQLLSNFKRFTWNSSHLWALAFLWKTIKIWKFFCRLYIVYDLLSSQEVLLKVFALRLIGSWWKIAIGSLSIESTNFMGISMVRKMDCVDGGRVANGKR